MIAIQAHRKKDFKKDFNYGLQNLLQFKKVGLILASKLPQMAFI